LLNLPPPEKTSESQALSHPASAGPFPVKHFREIFEKRTKNTKLLLFIELGEDLETDKEALKK